MTSPEASQIEALVRRYRDLGSEVAGMQEEQAEIKKQVDSLVEVGWKDQIDGAPVHKREANRSFCPITAASLLSPEDRKLCVVRRFDEKMLRAKVESAGHLDECMISRPDAQPVIKL